MNNKEKFLDILNSYSKVTVTETLRLKEDIKLDSLDLVELVMECEEKFGIEIPETKLYKVSTVQDIMSLIDELVGSD